MNTALTAIAGCFLVVAYCGCILLIREFSKWAIAREEGRAHLYIPSVDERVEADALIGLAEVDYWRGDVNGEFDRLLEREA